MHKSIKPWLGGALLFWALCVAVFLQAADPKTIEAIVEQSSATLQADKDLPGFSVAVLRQGEQDPVVRAFGYAQVENQVPMTTETVFKVGSITKVFTAALIYKLSEEGRLELDTTLEHFFPDFPMAKRIRVRDLLNHCSGIPEMLRLQAVGANLTKCWSPSEIISLVAAEPRTFEPGTKQMYCNTGYLMLAEIAEKASGRGYHQLVREMLAEKLGMQVLRNGTDTGVVPHISSGYTSPPEGGLQLPLMASVAIAKGTGDLLANPGDIVRLVNLGQVLKKNPLDFLTLVPHVLVDGTPATRVVDHGSYKTTQSELDGFTLFSFSDPSIVLIGKLGAFPGFNNAFFYDRQTGYAVVISVNNEKKLYPAMQVAARILDSLRDHIVR